MPNPIATENLLAGDSNSANYQITAAYNDFNYLGYADKTSYNAGETVNFKVDSSQNSNIRIYRMGHYDGDNWRLVDTVANVAVDQDSGSTITDSNGATTMSWSTTATWNIPSAAVSGLYTAVVLTAAGTPASWISFVVRNDGRRAGIVIGIPTSTWMGAYNYYGNNSAETSSLAGGSLYTDVGAGFDAANRTLAVSYNRPLVTHGNIVNHWDAYDLAAIDFFEQQGFDVKYVASEDVDEDPSRWADSTVYMSVGHDEYWSQPMRDNVEQFRDDGKHVMFLAGNEVWWRIRYADSYRTIWCYKDTLDGPNALEPRTAGAPVDPVSWTGTWRDSRDGSRDPAAEPENLLTGMEFRMNGPTFHTANLATATWGSDPFWRDTALESGDITLTNCIGFEANHVSNPGGREFVTLASQAVNVSNQYTNDPGDVYDGNGSFTWGIVMHRRATHEGFVVAFGSMGWLHMLSDAHVTGSSYGGSARKSVDAQQAMVNLLYDLGVEAETVDAALVEPTKVSLSTYGFTNPGYAYGFNGQQLTPWEYDGSNINPLIETDYVA